MQRANGRPRILALVRAYLPGFQSGGPVRSLSGLVDWLGDELDISIVTRDRDFLGPRYDNVRVGAWQPVGGASVYYAGPDEVGLRGLARILRGREFDVLYLNSFFDPMFTFRPLILRRAGLIPRAPTIIAPRGELGAGALQFKARKKQAYTWAVAHGGLLRGVTWHASTDAEAAEIRARVGAQAQVAVARNLAARGAPTAPSAEPVKARGRLRIVFLSRIAPKKNLLGALEAVAGLEGDVQFDIFGPREDAAYWSRCQSVLDRLPPNVTARYMGSVPHDRARGVLSEYDLFLLPTLNENFGHAILDAFIAGCPVMISDQTPWRGLEERGVGWDVPIDEPAALVAALQRAVAGGPEEWRAMRARARDFGASRLADAESVARTRALFRDAIARGAS